MSRVDELIAGMTLEQKLAQLVGLWAGAKRTDDVAPLQDRLLSDSVAFESAVDDGLGQLTRHYGTVPLDPEAGRRLLAERQEHLRAATPHGIPAIVHEECLTGVMAWGATAYPTPLAWGATWDPELAAELGRRIGDDLAALGIHQGLGPVLDVVRDARWGRVEECIGEDPHLVGAIGSAYVSGLEAAGRVATLKHFAGYSASQAGRNHAPVSAGPHELADAILPPFERAVVEGGARSVMNSYAEIDGMPAASDERLLTGLLRDRWGFDGTVVADYFAVAMLETTHQVVDTLGEAAAAALAAGIDVELPTGSAYLGPLAGAVRDGSVDEALVDRALERVLHQKEQLGLLDPDLPTVPDGPLDLDSAANRELARRIAERSIVLLANDGTLPLRVDGSTRRVLITGPNADAAEHLLGCYSFVSHVLPRHPEFATGIELPSVADALERRLADGDPAIEITRRPGCGVDDGDASGIPEAVEAARAADVAVVVLGDRSGLFGRGTSGEGCDRVDLELPGAQRQLAEAIIATGTPTVLVLVTGRPYGIDGLLESAAAVVQAFLPGEEGGAAIAAVLAGDVDAGGRLPVSLPRRATPQPATYRHPVLGGSGGASSADPTPLRPFGFGLSYTTFEHDPVRADAAIATVGDDLTLRVVVRNTGDRAGDDVVQLYQRRRGIGVTRPVLELLGFRRVPLAGGASATVEFTVPGAALAFADRDGVLVQAPGVVEFGVGSDAASVTDWCAVELTGTRHPRPAPGWTRSAILA